VVTGPDEAPPLLILAGVHAGAPRMLELFWTLNHDFRIYALDTIGQPGRSAQTRPSTSHHNYGKWVVGVLDGLGLESLDFPNISFGAGIFLDTVTFTPERITRAVLVVPTGIVKGPFFRIAVRLFLPWFLYRLFPSRKRLRRAVRSLMEPDEELLTFFDVILRNVKFAVTPFWSLYQGGIAKFPGSYLDFVSQG
jgi:pimeloyl-ACP methyl ester carboxylesterase